MDIHNVSTGVPYSSTGSFMDFFEGLTYEHVNFIFADAMHGQESMNPSIYASFCKFGLSEPGSVSYYDHSYAHVVNDHAMGTHEYGRHLESSSTMTNEEAVAVHTQWAGNSSTATHVNPVECPRSNNNARDHQVIWQDNIDPDNMTYEELLELGEAVGTQSRGLSQDLISLLPVSKFKCGFFSRKKSRYERCVICQMGYKRGDRLITVPCKHAYHVGCGTRWLSMNKACPICYTEVFGEASKH